MPAVGPSPPDGDVLGGTPILIIQSMFITIATMLIAIRLYVRVKISHALGLDDFFIVFGLVRELYLSSSLKLVDQLSI